LKDKKKPVGASLKLAKKNTTEAAADIKLAGQETTNAEVATLEVVDEKAAGFPFYPAEINGKTYKLCFELRQLSKAEQELNREGHPVNMLLALNVGSLDLNAVQTLFAASVRTYHPELKYEAAIDLITMESVYSVAIVILDALGIEHLGGSKKVADPGAPAPSKEGETQPAG
jgi:hypothetical protein